jgi:hypothetical protein
VVLDVLVEILLSFNPFARVLIVTAKLLVQLAVPIIFICWRSDKKLL